MLHSPALSGALAASKIALMRISETLRLELVPFCVKVVSVETGAVQSQGQTKLPQLKLPQNSYYNSVEEDIAKRSRGEDGWKRMNTKVYADRVVDDVLGGASGLVWRRTQATTIKWLSALLPTFVMVGPKKRPHQGSLLTRD